jgi:hypothetical protein
MPVAMVNILDYCDRKPDLQSLAYSIYFLLYCVNCVVYAVWHPEFRRAYVRFLGRLVTKFSKKMPYQRQFQFPTTAVWPADE